MADGLLDLSFWGLVGATGLLTHLTIISVTVYLHRHQAHRALELHPAVSHLFRFWLWLTTGMVTREWVAVHRRHHAFCETPDDPHSPRVLGIRRVLWQGAELYQDAIRDAETLERFGSGTPDDWLERRVYSGHRNLGIILMLAIDLLLFGLPGITIWAVQMLWIPFWAAGVINGLGHWWGYRNYECSDAATNVVPWGLVVGGEELHNNHHAFPDSARLSSRPWELDLGWGWIRLLAALGLARVRRVAPRLARVGDKPAPDKETLRAVLRCRMLVLSGYARSVIRPVLKAELARADSSCRQALKRARGALVRDRRLLDEALSQRLSSALEASTTLNTVYQFRLDLQAIWERRSASPAETLAALKAWCQAAEASGIRALEEFAREMRGYTLSPN